MIRVIRAHPYRPYCAPLHTHTHTTTTGMAAVKLYLESLCRYNAAEAHQILSSVAMLKYHNLRTIMSIAFEEVPDHIYPPPPPPQLQAITMGVPVGPIDPSGCPSAKSVALHRGNSELINKCLRSREMEIYAEVGGCGDDISQLPETLKDYVNGKVCYVSAIAEHARVFYSINFIVSPI